MAKNILLHSCIELKRLHLTFFHSKAKDMVEKERIGAALSSLHGFSRGKAIGR